MYTSLNIFQKFVLVACLFLALPLAAFTQSKITVTVDSISGDGVEVVPPVPTPPTGDSSVVAIRGTIGTDYTMVFSVDEQPAVVAGLGLQIDSYSYDDAEKKLTLQAKQLEFIDTTSPRYKNPGYDFFMLVFTKGNSNNPPPSPTPRPSPPPQQQPPPPQGPAVTAATPSGPPIESRGTYFSTNLNPGSLEILPPQVGRVAFGFKLSGPKGKFGLFRMFLPADFLTHISRFSDETLTPEKLAVFNKEQGRENQSSNTITNVNGGALVNVGVEFVDGSTRVRNDFDPTRPQSLKVRTSAAAPRDPVKEITIAEKLNVSFAPENFTISKNSFSVYGFLKTVTSGEKVSIQERQGKKWKTISTTVAGTDGSYSKKIKLAKLKGASASGFRAQASKKYTLRARAISGLTSAKATLTR